MSTIESERRYYLLKRLRAKQRDEDSAGIWKSKQEAVAGTALPATFPLLSRLSTAGYTTTEDLHGSDATELSVSGFSARESELILAALAPLL